MGTEVGALGFSHVTVPVPCPPCLLLGDSQQKCVACLTDQASKTGSAGEGARLLLWPRGLDVFISSLCS